MESWTTIEISRPLFPHKEHTPSAVGFQGALQLLQLSVNDKILSQEILHKHNRGDHLRSGLHKTC